MRILKAQYDRRGPVPQDVIAAVPCEKPSLHTGQVLIEVLATPINPSDILQLTGMYGILPPLPAVGGNEGVGRVVELGPDTAGPAVGQTVLLPPDGGAWATHVVADAAKLIPLPGGADPRQLCMLTINPPTASILLSDYVKLSPGDWVIQNASNSGVGSYLIQLAKQRGLKTINVVRRESAVDGVRKMGGDVVLVDNDKLHKDVREQSGGAEIRLAIDAVGGVATEHLASCLAAGSTVVNYGAMGGESCMLSPRSLIFKGITLKGFWLMRWFQTTTREKQIALYSELTQLLAQGAIQAPIHAMYPLTEIKDAIRAAHAGERAGKILLVSEELLKR
jgi:NADPH:quinone reductase-like Zn-dependent oxidoreductase